MKEHLRLLFFIILLGMSGPSDRSYSLDAGVVSVPLATKVVGIVIEITTPAVSGVSGATVGAVAAPIVLAGAGIFLFAKYKNRFLTTPHQGIIHFIEQDDTSLIIDPPAKSILYQDQVDRVHNFFGIVPHDNYVISNAVDNIIRKAMRGHHAVWKDLFTTVEDSLNTCDLSTLQTVRRYFFNTAGVLRCLMVPQAIAEMNFSHMLFEPINRSILRKLNDIAYHLNRCDLNIQDADAVKAFKYAHEAVSTKNASVRRACMTLLDMYHETLTGHGCPPILELEDLTNLPWNVKKLKRCRYHKLLDTTVFGLNIIEKLYALTDRRHKKAKQLTSEWTNTVNDMFSSVKKGRSTAEAENELRRVHKELKDLVLACKIEQKKKEHTLCSGAPLLPNNDELGCGTGELPSLDLPPLTCNPESLEKLNGVCKQVPEVPIPDNECNYSKQQGIVLEQPDVDESPNPTEPLSDGFDKNVFFNQSSSLGSQKKGHLLVNGKTIVLDDSISEEDALLVWEGSKEFSLLKKRIKQIKMALSNIQVKHLYNKDISQGELLKLLEQAENLKKLIGLNDDDIKKIATHTGISTQTLKKIKSHLFEEEHRLVDFIKEGTIVEKVGSFDADIDIMQVWSRLQEGTYVASDLDLLVHEYAELLIMNGTSVRYDIAHHLSLKYYKWI